MKNALSCLLKLGIDLNLSLRKMTDVNEWFILIIATQQPGAAKEELAEKRR